jgi:hypothetical protein
MCLSHDGRDTQGSSAAQKRTRAQPGMNHLASSTGTDISPLQQAEISIDHLFASNQVSPSDQTLSTMNLNWDGECSLRGGSEVFDVLMGQARTL